MSGNFDDACCYEPCLVTPWWYHVVLSLLDQVMASLLFGAKPSPEPVLTIVSFDAQGQTSVQFQSKSISSQEN